MRGHGGAVDPGGGGRGPGQRLLAERVGRGAADDVGLGLFRTTPLVGAGGLVRFGFLLRLLLLGFRVALWRLGALRVHRSPPYWLMCNVSTLPLAMNWPLPWW